MLKCNFVLKPCFTLLSKNKQTNKNTAFQECIVCEQAVSENELNRFTNHRCSNSKGVFLVRCRHRVVVLLLQRAPDTESSRVPALHGEGAPACTQSSSRTTYTQHRAYGHILSPGNSSDSL